jgi:hypothetical protein
MLPHPIVISMLHHASLESERPFKRDSSREQVAGFCDKEIVPMARSKKAINLQADGAIQGTPLSTIP